MINNKFKAILILFVIIFSMLTFKFEVVVPGDGIIVGGVGDIDIITPDSGFINLVNVKEGSKINIDDVIFSYNNLEVHYREKALSNLISFLKDKKNKLEIDVENLQGLYSITEKGLDKDISFNFDKTGINTIRYLRELTSISRKKKELELRRKMNINERNEINVQKKLLLETVDLLNKSNSPKIEILGNQKEAAQLSTSMIRLDSDLLASEVEVRNAEDEFQISLLEKINLLSEEIIKIDRELIESNDSLSLTKGKQKANVITSPVAGTVMSIEKQFTVGSYIESSQKVMTIKQTQSKSLIKAKVTAKFRPFINDGDKVKIVVNSPGYKHALEGDILSISVDSIKDEDNPSKAERFYEVEINPNKLNAFTSEMIGVQANIYVVTDSITIFEYITATIVDNIRFNVW